MNDFFEDRPKLNVFDKIRLWWKFHARYYHKDFVRGIQKLRYWFPIIWKDRDWDQHYIFEVLKHKLKAQANYISKNDRHTRAQQDARNMRICVKLINICQDETYGTEYMDYVKDRSWFETCKDNPKYSTWENEIISENFDDLFKKYPLIHKRVMKGEGPFTLDGGDEKEIKRRVAMNICRINQQRAHKLLFKIMESEIEKWWD
jgi:hypothetical protein